MKDEATKEIERLRGIRTQLTKQVGRLKERIRQFIACKRERDSADMERMVREVWQAEKEVDALLDWLGYEQPPPVMASVL